jgi:hypothetical protein
MGITLNELKAGLTELLSQEEQAAVDWDRVQDLSIRLLAELRSGAGHAIDYPAEVVIPYLTEFDRRRADSGEATRQRTRLVGYLRAI